MGRSLFDKIWDQHVIADLGSGMTLLHMDRVLLHDLSGFRALKMLEERGEAVVNPSSTLACPDHTAGSQPGAETAGSAYLRGGPEFRQLCERYGIPYYHIGDDNFGILHIIGPELGITLPGVTLVCGDSHTCTHGGLGALAWGIGSTELVHVLATQTLMQRKPKVKRIRFEGQPGPGVTSKDMILHAIGREGTRAGDGFAIEYAGSAIESMDIEGRMTICNLSIEMGSKIGMTAPDEKTFNYLRGRKHAPKDGVWDQAVKHWRALVSDEDAVFDDDTIFYMNDIRPQITWGTSPEHVISIDQSIPDPDKALSRERCDSERAALEYIGLRPGMPIEGVSIDWVFIGSCTNSRITDLRAAAEIIKGRKVADNVTAWAVPGSAAVRLEAEAEGLDKIFVEAGFEWRAPSCSMCVGANGDIISPGQRSVSTSNRNFVGRQGPGARTHLASPAMAAAAAVTGKITDVRKLMR
ncbi:MAG: 3-isopropylmalate dehydratase large subunit [Rhodospirillaceae bacterium TMED8]|nr:3-isopropylmalate dehydratase large subunit [Magnetovibrio sp.]OUT50234.1 MAG: 3-isopropylmalate dehydratase large subunit [Rhodospirillaceae bacterium TMED8]|tara:strand:- start:4880 stop:6280 length:1401 start_codon:yes stop_codon:yes gene_type:complete